MITVETVADLRHSVSGWRAEGERVALVPTMGNLHEGHLDLVRKARSMADRVIVSIFVNPLQFGEGEDFSSYPRTLIDDSDKLSGVGADLLFTPTVNEMYSRPQAIQTKIEVPGLSQLFCGASRPGHFVGVAMGNLHEGHLDLVRKARSMADRVIVSIFVNPLQFGEGEDFSSYPRTLIDDSDKLSGVGADLLFTPTVNEMYSRPQAIQTKIEVPGLSQLFCGASRPGHFVGVATVVCKLFNMAQPDLALFGEKDYQQLMVIRQMVEDLSLPIEVQGLPTVREVDGLARSSRNGYLTDTERSIAPALYRQLQRSAAALQQGNYDRVALEQQAMARLESEGFTPDYYAICKADDLSEPTSDDKSLVILAAAYLGKARLIDNIQITLA